jgi:cytochrome oxidase Cu insertion factor (SCO1/SenC/PrrC family)
VNEKRFSGTLFVGFFLIALTVMVGLAEMKLARERARPAFPVIGPVADFTLTNQDGRAMSLADLRGKVWVGDIIFTRCAGPCPRMTKQMRDLQDSLPAASTTRLVTLTTDADYDTPPVLKKYADKYGADPARWNFLTGDKRDVAHLAIDSLKLTTVAKKPEERTSDVDLFVHSTIFVVVDKQARLRMTFETGGEGVDWQQSKSAILDAVSQLENEP